MAPRPLRKRFLRLKPSRAFSKDLHTFQWGRERIYNEKFSKVNALRKGGQEETYLKFSQAEESTKVV